MQPSETAGAAGTALTRSNRAPTHASARCLLLFLFICTVYLATLSDRYFGLISDGQVMFHTAVSLHEFGELGIGPEIDPKTGVMIRPDHYGKYGLGFPVVLQLPLLVVAPLEKALGQGRSNVLFPMTNMLLTAATALLVALCLRDLGFRFRTAVLAATGFALGSFAWPYISYDFSEPLQALCVAAAFWLLIRALRLTPPSTVLLSLAGFALGFAVLTKGALAILIPSYLFYLWSGSAAPPRTRLRHLAWFAAPLLIWSAAIAALNLHRFGSALDFGYGGESGQFTTPILTGLYGLLLSPNKGLIFYAPLALLAPWSLWRMRKAYRAECLFLVSVFALQIFVSAKWWSWEGGASWGPRLLLPMLPLLILCAGMLLESARWSMGPFVACMAAGVAINLLGVLSFFPVWGYVVDLNEARIPLDVRGRPAHEYVEKDGKKWFVPNIATYYLPALSPLRGHAWLLRLRYFDDPFPIRTLCDGASATAPRVSFPPIEMNFAQLNNPVVVSQLCSAHFWLWKTLSGQPRDGNLRYSLYGFSLELQGNRAWAKGDLQRAVECYKRTADLMPHYVEPTRKLAGVLALMGKVSEAEKTLTSFLSQHPMETSVRLMLARLYDLTGNRAAALREYRALLGFQPDEKTSRVARERIDALQRADH
jgi:hypothetical protein